MSCGGNWGPGSNTAQHPGSACHTTTSAGLMADDSRSALEGADGG